MRKTFIEEQIQLANMRRGVQAYVRQQLERDYAVCPILVRYVEQYEAGILKDVVAEEEAFAGSGVLDGSACDVF